MAGGGEDLGNQLQAPRLRVELQASEKGASLIFRRLQGDCCTAIISVSCRKLFQAPCIPLW